MADDLEVVRNHLLRERDRHVKKVLGISRTEIVKKFVDDLYSLPGNGGSDERRLAREWIERRNDLIFDHEHGKVKYNAFFDFYTPTISETEEILRMINNKSSFRSR